MQDSLSLLRKKEIRWKSRYFNQDFKRKLKPYISKSRKHLDFGCGYGFLIFLLARDYPTTEFYGVDFDDKSIKLGKKKYHRENLHLICTDKLAGKFDSISAFFLVHHLKKMTDKYLKGFHDHLNRGGKIIIFDFRKVSRLKYKKWYDKKKNTGEYTDDFEKSFEWHCRWSVKQFSSMMEKNGFKTLEAEDVDDFWFFYAGEK
jgi:cyclopropane fatty-acyl-phospholipid synthase-like methyltransferase